ncbi:MAG: hypothetical protein R3266_11745, partial [Gemmatimonadota bacterium]|nr:hypothetical protein [Gemmatimonadota bacterium]
RSSSPVRREEGGRFMSVNEPRRRPRACALVAAVLALFASGSALAQEPPEETDPLGEVHLAVSCSEEAQRVFDRGVALLHHMTYPRAREAFAQVAELDPQCAMAHWGRAMTLFHPLWPTRPGPEALRQGWEAVQRAKALSPPTEHERLHVAAVEAFYRDPDEADYWTRIRRWERAMERLYRAYPDRPEARAFYALAHLAAGRASEHTLAHHERAAALLTSIHAEQPTHPGATHYLIHANDIRGREHESVDIVRSYGEIAPQNPHALHMPTHIFTRLGYWDDVIAWNHRAAEAALAHEVGERDRYVWDEFPHAVEYLVYAYLQQGDDDAAATQLERLRSTVPLQPSFKTAFHLSSVPARYALERRAWEEAAGLVPRAYEALDWDGYPWAEAVTWFVRGLGAARLGRGEDARRAQTRLEELEGAATKAGEELFARRIHVLGLAVSGWIAHAEGERERALALMEQAAELEVATPKSPVTPAPTLPAFELLGELLLELGEHGAALAAFERSLELYPRRFHSLLGAARASRGLHAHEPAANYYAELLEVGVSDSKREGLREARDFLDAHAPPLSHFEPGSRTASLLLWARPSTPLTMHRKSLSRKPWRAPLFPPSTGRLILH